MATDIEKLQLRIEVDPDTGKLKIFSDNVETLSQRVDKAGKSGEGMTSNYTQLFRRILPAVTAGGALYLMVNLLKSSVAEAEASNEALRRLQSALENSGISWDKNNQSIISWGESIGETTRFAKDQAIVTLQKFIQVGRSLSESMLLTKTAMGMSVKTGNDLAVTTDQLTGLLTGESARLKVIRQDYKNIIGSTTDAREVMQKLADSFAGAAEKEDNFTKKTATATHRWNEFKESVGRFEISVLDKIITGWEHILGLAGKLNAQRKEDIVGTVKLGEVNTNVIDRIIANDKKVLESVKEVTKQKIAEVKSIKDRAEAEKTFADEYKKIEADLTGFTSGEWVKKIQEAEAHYAELKNLHVANAQEQEQLDLWLSGKKIEIMSAEVKSLQDFYKKEKEDAQKAANESWEEFSKIYAMTGEQVVNTFEEMRASGMSFTESFGKAFERMMKNMMVQMAAAAVKWAIFNAMTGGSAAGAGAGVSFTKALFGFKEGGEVPADMVAKVHKGEYIIPKNTVDDIKGSGGMGGGGNTYHINITAQPLDLRNINDKWFNDFATRLSSYISKQGSR